MKTLGVATVVVLLALGQRSYSNPTPNSTKETSEEPPSSRQWGGGSVYPYNSTAFPGRRKRDISATSSGRIQPSASEGRWWGGVQYPYNSTVYPLPPWLSRPSSSPRPSWRSQDTPSGRQSRRRPYQPISTTTKPKPWYGTLLESLGSYPYPLESRVPPATTRRPSSGIPYEIITGVYSPPSRGSARYGGNRGRPNQRPTTRKSATTRPSTLSQWVPLGDSLLEGSSR